MRRLALHDDSSRRGRFAYGFWLPLICTIWLAPLMAAPDDESSNRGSKSPGVSPVETITGRIKQDLEKSTPGSSRGGTQVAAAPKKSEPKPAPTAKNETATEADKPADKADDKPANDQPGSATKRPKPGSTAAKGAASRAKAVEAEAQKLRTADEALAHYKEFLAADDTTEKEKEDAQPRLEYWEQAAKDGLVRVGAKWIPKDEADKLKEEADKLVAEALKLLDVKSYKKADEKLEKASRIYPEHLESVFLLGVGAFLTKDMSGAQRRFDQCLVRAPNNVAVLNNSAMCAAANKKFDRTVKLWEKALGLEPDNPDVIANLGQFVTNATRGKEMSKTEKEKAVADAAKAKAAGRVFIDTNNVTRRVLDDATELYAKFAAGAKVERDGDTGYVMILRLYPSTGGERPAKPGETEITGNGSGFVIWDGYVMTNQHVVEGAGELLLQDPANPNKPPLPGKVIAQSKELDLAIIQCAALKAPVVPVNSAQVTRGTEVMALGFPIANVVGRGLKVTKGIVTGLPSKDTKNMMVLDAQINPGNSGGPLCDKAGRVIGVVAAVTYNERFVQGYGLAIPMADAVPFIRRSIPDFVESKTAETKKEWTDVDEQISKSTILVLIKKKGGAPPTNSPPKAAPSTSPKPSTKPNSVATPKSNKS